MSERSNSTSTAIVAIGNVDVPILAVNGQRVVTLAMVDAVHQRPEGTARRTFAKHRARLAEGEDFVAMSADEIRTRFPGVVSDRATEALTLLTETGYLMLVKSFTDDLAWEVQRKLVTSYFRVKDVAAGNDNAALMKVLGDPDKVRVLLLGYADKVLELEAENAALVPKAEAHDRIAAADGSHCITDAAKALQVRPKDLFGFLCQNGWIYRRPGADHWCGYQARLASGDLAHKVTTVLRSDGSEKTTEQVRVTGRGLAKLAKLMPGALRGVA